MKVNCADHSSFCRRKKIKHFPWLEIYIPEAVNPTFHDQMIQRLLKGDGKYTVCPFRSDFSYQGIKGALEEIGLIPKKDPYLDTKVKFKLDIEERLRNTEQI